MAQAIAGIFLILLVIGVLKMVADVQAAKLKRIIDTLNDYINDNK